MCLFRNVCCICLYVLGCQYIPYWLKWALTSRGIWYWIDKFWSQKVIMPGNEWISCSYFVIEIIFYSATLLSFSMQVHLNFEVKHDTCHSRPESCVWHICLINCSQLFYNVLFYSECLIMITSLTCDLVQPRSHWYKILLFLVKLRLLTPLQ